MMAHRSKQNRPPGAEPRTVATSPDGAASPPSRDRRAPPQVELRWRDENYGSVHAVAAFRNYADTSAWSERTYQHFRGCLKRAGFEIHHGRVAYISSKRDGPSQKRAICDELAAAGFEIIHGDVRGKS